MQIRTLAASLALAATAALVAAPFAAAGGNYGAAAGKPGNIVQVAKSAGSFNTLIKALEATDLVGTLSGQGKGPFTVFAPTDAAFNALPAGTLDALLADPARLKSILLYHVVEGDVRAAQVVGLSSARTVNGAALTITVNGGAVKVNDANVVKTDVLARNGVIHVIDKVLIP
uniref:Fasciclin domain-containing protein n=1 Tax=Eiseniibacteriota bacterium TaxID=2212470 RepID=A0A832I8B3_UNCEI